MGIAIRKYFEQYGEVEAVLIREGRHDGFVQFKTAESVKELIGSRVNRSIIWYCHSIENCPVKLRAANFWHLPDSNQHPLSLPPDQESPKQILNKLDDDCLEAVFKYLDMIDLCNAAEVCKRFNQRAKDAFRLKYKKIDLSEWKIQLMEDNEFKSLLNNFGPSIISIVFMGGGHMKYISDPDDILHKIQAKCVHLKELTVRHIPDFDVKLQPMFAKLERLEFDHCELDNKMKDFLSARKNLKKLGLVCCKNESDELIMQKFPMLVEAKITSLSKCSGDALKCFIALNSTLEKFEFGFSDEHVSGVYSAIAHNLPNLSELRSNLCVGDDFHRDTEFVGQIRTLKVLDINLGWFPITPLVNSLVTNKTPIESFSLRKCDIDDETVEGLSQLKQIKILGLFCFRGDIILDEYIIKLAEELPELNELHLGHYRDIISQITTMKTVVAHFKNLSKLYFEIDECFCDWKIDISEYKTLLQLVQNRSKKMGLLIVFATRGEIIVSEEMMEEYHRNSNILTLVPTPILEMDSIHAL